MKVQVITGSTRLSRGTILPGGSPSPLFQETFSREGYYEMVF